MVNTVLDGYRSKLGLSEWTGNDVNDKAGQAKDKGSGLEGRMISVGRKGNTIGLTYDLALDSKDRLRQSGRVRGSLYVLIRAIRET